MLAAGFLTQDPFYRYNDLNYRWIAYENWRHATNSYRGVPRDGPAACGETICSAGIQISQIVFVLEILVVAVGSNAGGRHLRRGRSAAVSMDDHPFAIFRTVAVPYRLKRLWAHYRGPRRTQLRRSTNSA